MQEIELGSNHLESLEGKAQKTEMGQQGDLIEKKIVLNKT